MVLFLENSAFELFFFLLMQNHGQIYSDCLVKLVPSISDENTCFDYFSVALVCTELLE